MITLSALDYRVGVELLSAIARILILVIALCMHEWAHAYAAYKCGDYTPKAEGRLTLNPLKHFDPFGFIMMLMVNVGYAKPVHINPYNFKHPKRDTIWVSFAGIVSNFVMAFFFVMVFTCVGTFAGDWLIAGISGQNPAAFFVVSLLQYGFLANISLMIFNLLPIYPLDGFHWVEVTTRSNNRFRTFMYRYGNWILIGLLLESVVANAIYRATGLSAFYYLDILGNFINQLSRWIIYPLQQLWTLFWGIFI